MSDFYFVLARHYTGIYFWCSACSNCDFHLIR